MTHTVFAENDKGKIKWQKEFEDDTYSYQVNSVDYSIKDEMIFVSGTYNSIKQGVSKAVVEGVWIKRIQFDGKQISNIRIDNNNYYIIEASKILSNGKLLLLIKDKYKKGGVNIVIINEKGIIDVTKELKPGVHIRKVIETRDNKLWMIGHRYLDSILIKIDAMGNQLVEKKIDREKDSLYVDGLLMSSGELLLVENSGKAEQFFFGKSKLILSLHDMKGDLLKEISFVGRYGSLSTNGNGKFAIEYDESDNSSQKIMVMGFDKFLSKEWKTKIFERPFGLTESSLSFIHNKYIVFGEEHFKPRLTVLTTTGELKETNNLKSEIPNLNLISFCVEKTGCFIVSTAMHVLDNKKRHNKIKIMLLKSDFFNP